MTLKFPDLDTLQLSITSGAVPSAVALAHAVAGSDDQNHIWVETTSTLSRAAQSQLREIGVHQCRTNGAADRFAVTCWPEILPLQPDADSVPRLEQTPILFEVASPHELGRLINEILRLGNDRQAFRWMENKMGAGRGLLRVMGPPYYSLLRAIDRGGQSSVPRAYREQTAGVWVEVGWAHPLADYFKPPPGKLLLVASPREWNWTPDEPFHDVYDVIEFALPEAPSVWREEVLASKIRAPLSLRPAGSADGAELWILRDDAATELNRFVQNADDVMLQRLAFAVGRSGDETVIVLRVRPSRLPPLELTLKAEAYKSYLKMPNLFLPAGMGLHPPLRRDMVRKLLADDPAKLFWLRSLRDGAFRPEMLSEDAFRPLGDWVDYVLDHEQETLQAWVQASQFDFEAFVCHEESPAIPKKLPSKRRRIREEKSVGGESADADATPVIQAAVKSSRPQAKEENKTEAITADSTEPDVLREELRKLEDQFTALEGGLDARERQAMWPRLANLNAAVGAAEEAGVCWLHALWGSEIVSEEYAWKWFCAEAAAVPTRPKSGWRNRSWAARLATAAGTGREITPEDLDKLLTLPDPTAADLRALAAYIVWALRRESPPQIIRDRLDLVQCFLQAHENLAPVRAVWLAWTHLSGGDQLALARARDRLLQRLFDGGLRLGQDLPGFLSGAGQSTSRRFGDMGQWLSDMAEKAREWIGKQGPEWTTQACTPRTREYSDLLFAYGLARLGERDACLRLRDRAARVLGDEDVAHFMLLQGFTYRIQQALDGKTSGGPLPTQMLDDLEKLRADRKSQKENNPQASDYAYMVERMRELSRILEPHQKVDPYRHLVAIASPLDAALADLPDVADKTDAAATVQRLLQGAAKGDRGTKDRNRIVRAGLDLAPRVGEDFALGMLAEAVALYDAQAETSDPNLLMDQVVPLLEKSLFVAGHFDSTDTLYSLVTRFRALLQRQRDAPEFRTLDAVANQCFRGQRKLGMRDEVNQLLQQTADVILRGQDLDDAVALGNAGGSALRSLLYVAAGWLHFGQERKAGPVLQAARSLLLRNELEGKEQSALACAYIAAAGQAPAKIAQKRIEEVFEGVKSVRDSFWTNNYYSQSQLRLIEAIVSAVVSDEFTLSGAARRWLDDDEYLVRQRIHKDYRAIAARGI
jgi:cellulose synthase operon protein C